MRSIIAFVLLIVVVPAIAASDTLSLEPAQLSAFAALKNGEILVLDAVPDGFGGSARLRFERIDVYAPTARIVVVDANGAREVPRSPRIELIGASADGTVRASLAFDVGFENVNGLGTSPAGAFVFTSVRGDHGVQLRAAPTETSLPAGVVPQIVSGDDALPSGNAPPDALTIALAGSVPSGSTRVAVVAIDTDNEFMMKRFSNGTAAATSWIADLFAAINVMYRRDLNVALQQGSTTLRTTTDPYAAANTPADGTDLAEFGSYWQAHYSSVPRSFAALLSGKSSSGNSASGIAWVNSYCQTQSQGGSYSVNQIFTNPQIGVGYSALIVGHELGHNFGAYHTHCTNASSGDAPTASNTIDQCYSGELNCYSGATSCPASGPGAPAGSVMSYCNIRGSCGSNGQNVLQFHPTQIGVLNVLIAQNTPSCLSSSADEIFSNGFD